MTSKRGPKILFVRINDKIGDTVIETFFYRELKRVYPTAHLTVMCCGNKAILQEIPYIDELIFLPPNGVRKILAAFLKIPWLCRQKYDLLISFTPHWRMRFFNAFIRAARKECFDLIQGAHVSAACKKVLERLGAKDVTTAYELSIPNKSKQAVELFLTANHLKGKPFLLFNPLGGAASRTLSPLRTTEILQNFTGCPVVLLDVFQNYPVQLGHVVSFTNYDIWQTVALTKKAAYVLTVDTATAHIAQTFNKPQTVLFSLKNYENEPAKDLSLLTTWGPQGEHIQRLWAEKSVNQIPVKSIVNSIQIGKK